jgi:hypothetical protein
MYLKFFQKCEPKTLRNIFASLKTFLFGIARINCRHPVALTFT